jgi:hypothetical protein
MKNTVLSFFVLLFQLSLFAQVDEHGNPVFNSISISEEKVDNFELTASYYTIDNNISEKSSSVYISEKPSLSEYLKFARDLPSYFFIVHKGSDILFMLMPMQENKDPKTTLFYNIVNPSNGKSMQIPCGVWGEISEGRAKELLRLKVDSTSKIIDLPNNGKGLLFDGIAYRIQSYSELKEEVIEIAKTLLNPPEKIKNPEEYVKKESIGGTLDFNKKLENETQAFFLYDGVMYNKKDFAIYLWARNVKDIGISSSKKATRLWEEVNKRELTDAEKKALVAGFSSEKKQ